MKAVVTVEAAQHGANIPSLSVFGVLCWGEKRDFVILIYALPFTFKIFEGIGFALARAFVKTLQGSQCLNISHLPSSGRSVFLITNIDRCIYI